MKNLFKRLPKKLIVAALSALTAGMVFGAVTSGSALLGGDREVRPYVQNGPGFNHVTFNSFTGVPNVGDERNFVTGKISEAPNGFYDPMNKVRAGDEILVRVYVHNNADPSLNESGQGVAKNTQVRVVMPDGLAQDQNIHAFISADNATPKTIEDTLSMNGEYPFQIEYVAGSARIKTNAMETALSDNIVTTGVQIGDDKLDGKMNGCFEYVALVTFKVKVKSPSYAVTKQVSKAGDASGSWQKTMNADKNDQQSWMITFKNSGSTELKNVKIVDEVPAGLEVIPGTVKLINGNYPDGYVYPDSAIQANGRQVNVDIGNYNPGGVAYVGFRTKIKLDEKECGVKQFVNKAYATPKDHGSIYDTATVNVDTKRECEEPEKPSYICEAITVDKIGGRKVRVAVKAPASGGAKLKNVTFNYGDGSEPKVTNSLVDEYEYKADGTFKIVVTAHFTVDGKDKAVSSDACTAKVTFDSEKPEEKPELPKTGAGNLIGLFTVVTIAAAAAHNVISRRIV